ncbi:hypothetical protein CYQ88_03645 [Hydrogenovibrio sp. SC-1]|uniref:STAS domain-containing protein n=1 Tax=Hydrogenovibrio sp. SC-1 TaxID=2065820 RepID=UPI000C7CB190|nr:STAS domain-containing protein [Hydrogenovibrio sp. SC-1]PLA75003.1 hypothetical protein CYQ88_03645 [Hydrogenovibrio sp. SC-1]
MSENIIELPENLTIHHIEEQFRELKIAFESDSETYKINATKVESIDTSGLQALLSLIKYAQDKQKNIVWDGVTDEVLNGAKKIGLVDKLLLAS